jgi:hypothetical protein
VLGCTVARLPAFGLAQRHSGSAGPCQSAWRRTWSPCRWRAHSGPVARPAWLTGVQPEESLLASAWGWRGEGSQRGALRRDSSTGGRPKRLVDTRTSTAGGRWLRGCFGDPAWTRGNMEECSGPRRASRGEERAARERKEKGSATTTDSL